MVRPRAAVDPNDVPALLEKAATLADWAATAKCSRSAARRSACRPATPLAFYLQAVMAARVGNWPLAAMMMQRTQGVLDDVPAVMLIQGSSPIAPATPIRRSMR